MLFLLRCVVIVEYSLLVIHIGRVVRTMRALLRLRVRTDSPLLMMRAVRAMMPIVHAIIHWIVWRYAYFDSC